MRLYLVIHEDVYGSCDNCSYSPKYVDSIWSTRKLADDRIDYMVKEIYYIRKTLSVDIRKLDEVMYVRRTL